MKNFAFVFPGQGSQSVGMLDGWGDHPAVVQTLQEASDALGEDMGLLIQQGPKEALALTTNTQPVMLVAGVAAWRVWRAEGGALPAAVAGASLGEYSAPVASWVVPRGHGAARRCHGGSRSRGHRRHGGHSGAGCCKSDSWLRRSDGRHGPKWH